MTSRSLSNGNRSRRSRAFSPGFFRAKLHKSSKLAGVSPDRTRAKTHDSAAAPPVGQTPSRRAGRRSLVQGLLRRPKSKVGARARTWASGSRPRSELLVAGMDMAVPSSTKEKHGTATLVAGIAGLRALPRHALDREASPLVLRVSSFDLALGPLVGRSRQVAAGSGGHGCPSS